MDTTTCAKNESESGSENLNCWTRDPNAQCLRIEKLDETIVVVPYLRFESASFKKGPDGEVVELHRAARGLDRRRVHERAGRGHVDHRPRRTGGEGQRESQDPRGRSFRSVCHVRIPG